MLVYRDRRPCYPSDVTDARWQVPGPRAREVTREPAIAAGRPMVHDPRSMCDAVSYVAENGIEWRALPADFPPWEAVYAFFERWNDRGLPAELVRRLRELLRRHQGRAAQPAACITDSQMVKPTTPSPARPAATTAARRSPAMAGTSPSTPRAGCSPWQSPQRPPATRPARRSCSSSCSTRSAH
jgi:transposase